MHLQILSPSNKVKLKNHVENDFLGVANNIAVLFFIFGISISSNRVNIFDKVFVLNSISILYLQYRPFTAPIFRTFFERSNNYFF